MLTSFNFQKICIRLDWPGSLDERKNANKKASHCTIASSVLFSEDSYKLKSVVICQTNASETSCGSLSHTLIFLKAEHYFQRYV